LDVVSEPFDLPALDAFRTVAGLTHARSPEVPAVMDVLAQAVTRALDQDLAR
jgi:hypothetical protein